MRIEECDAPQSRAQIAPLFAAVYPPEILEKMVWRDVTSAKADRRIIAFDSLNQPAAVAGLLFRDALIDGKPIRIGGIGGVMTSPNLQRQGFGSSVMLRAHDVLMRDHRAAFGLLFCEPKNITFYEKLGWVVFAGTVIVKQPAGIAPYTVMTPMVRSFHSHAPQSGILDLRGLPW